MIAAAARRSGTRSPLASTLYRGVTVSAISRAVATARATAERERTVVAVDAGAARLARAVVDSLVRFWLARRGVVVCA